MAGLPMCCCSVGACTLVILLLSVFTFSENTTCFWNSSPNWQIGCGKFQYHIEDDYQLNWTAAGKFCEKRESELATFDREAYDDFRHLLTNLSGNYWIGGEIRILDKPQWAKETVISVSVEGNKGNCVYLENPSKLCFWKKMKFSYAPCDEKEISLCDDGKYTDKKESWFRGRERCLKRGSDLIVAKALEVKKNIFSSEKFWIGLSRKQFLWTNTDVGVTFMDWDVNQPEDEGQYLALQINGCETKNTCCWVAKHSGVINKFICKRETGTTATNLGLSSETTTSFFPFTKVLKKHTKKDAEKILSLTSISIIIVSCLAGCLVTGIVVYLCFRKRKTVRAECNRPGRKETSDENSSVSYANVNYSNNFNISADHWYSEEAQTHYETNAPERIQHNLQQLSVGSRMNDLVQSGEKETSVNLPLNVNIYNHMTPEFYHSLQRGEREAETNFIRSDNTYDKVFTSNNLYV